MAHAEVFNIILHDRHTANRLCLEDLRELALTTAVLSRAAVDGNAVLVNRLSGHSTKFLFFFNHNK